MGSSGSTIKAKSSAAAEWIMYGIATVATSVATVAATVITNALVLGAIAVSTAVIFVAVVLVLCIAVICVSAYLLFDADDSDPPDFPSTTSLNEFPYHASIHMNDLHFCSGAFIGGKLILTVAQLIYIHAANQISKSQMKVYVNIRDIPTISRYGYDVDEIIVHPNFNRDKYAYNIAIVRLTEKVTQPRLVQPITLPSPDIKITGTKVYVSGFVKHSVLDAPTELTKTKMIIINESDCKKHFDYFCVTSRKFCVIPDRGYKYCKTGVGGTAATEEKVLIGLYVMENLQGCDTGLPEMFVNVALFRDFIDKEIFG